MKEFYPEIDEDGDLSLRVPVPRAGDEIAALGATINDLLARMQEALERERSFVADAGHELRTPLAILRAELELAAWTSDGMKLWSRFVEPCCRQRQRTTTRCRRRAT